MRLRLLFGLALLAAAGPAFAEGDLARKPVKLPDLLFGSDESGFAVSQKRYELKTGTAYRLVIRSSGKDEYSVRGPDFFGAVYLRRIAADEVEIETAGINAINFEEEGEVTIDFIPVRPGTYRIWAARLEDRGTFTTIVVK